MSCLGDSEGIYVVCYVKDLHCCTRVDTSSTIKLIQPGVLPNTQWKNPTGWEATNVQLAPVTGAPTRMQGMRQLTVSVNGVMVEQEVWLEDIVEPFILGLDASG